MKRKPVFWFVLFMISVVLLSANESLAAPYYEGKTIRIIVGFAPGGGYDRMARLMAKHLPKHIPGKPSIIVENMTGASGLIATNYLYNIAKPDGLTIGTNERSHPIAQLVKTEGIKFDIMKFSWIGSTAVETTILALRTDVPYKTIEDLKKVKDPIHLTAMGVGTSDTQFDILLREFCGVNLKLVIYNSSADCMLAIERKEVGPVEEAHIVL